MPDKNEFDTNLMNSDKSPDSYGPLYQEHVFEQYKLCLEMADRISSRRGNTNTFYLSFNTAIVGALVTFFERIPYMVGIAFYFSALLLCVAWGIQLRSYRSLNRAKFEVIGQMEQQLPASPFWVGEWKKLDEGRNYRKHLPLSLIETSVPLVFILIYCYLATIDLSV